MYFQDGPIPTLADQDLIYQWERLNMTGVTDTGVSAVKRRTSFEGKGVSTMQRKSLRDNAYDGWYWPC